MSKSRHDPQRQRPPSSSVQPAVPADLREEARGLFGPQSMVWRVNREAVLLLGGGRALLMQLAHPLVAAGVAEHSDFRADPLGRLQRTLDTMLSIVFATSSEALAATRRINEVHSRVTGTLPHDSGWLPAGTVYDARDPTLLLWVHATLVDTALLVYERFVARLSAYQKHQYYEDSKTTALLLGVPESVIPRRLKNFRAFVRKMIASEDITVSETARELADEILHPSVPVVAKAFARVVHLATVGLLPPQLRWGYGLTWGVAQETTLRALSGVLRLLMPWIPDALRIVPQARAAEERLRVLS